MSDVRVAVWAYAAATGWRTVGLIDSWESLTAEPRWNDVGTWSLRLPLGEQALLIRKNRLVTLTFRGQRMTGLVSRIEISSGEDGAPMLEVSGVDALALLGDVLCWPVPSQPLGSQTKGRYRASGPAETVILDLIRKNIARRGDPVTVPSSRGRGSDVSVSVRMANLLDVATRKAEAGGLGLRMGLADAGSRTRGAMRVEVVEPQDRSNRVRLSHRVGTLRTWKQADDAPAATRAVVGGPGAGKDRIFRLVVDSATESEWGRKREVLVDARNVDNSEDSNPTTSGLYAELDAAGAEALTGTTASFDLEATDAEGMRYGEHFALGDLVTIELLTGVRRVETLRAVRVAASASDGLTVSLVPGDPDAQSALIGQAAILRGIRRQVKNLEQEA